MYLCGLNILCNTTVKDNNYNLWYTKFNNSETIRSNFDVDNQHFRKKSTYLYTVVVSIYSVKRVVGIY